MAAKSFTITATTATMLLLLLVSSWLLDDDVDVLDESTLSGPLIPLSRRMSHSL